MFRMHDPRVGRFLSLDPISANYPHNSPYAFAENRVIDGIELEGAEYLNANTQWKRSWNAINGYSHWNIMSDFLDDPSNFGPSGLQQVSEILYAEQNGGLKFIVKTVTEDGIRVLTVKAYSKILTSHLVISDYSPEDLPSTATVGDGLIAFGETDINGNIKQSVIGGTPAAFDLIGGRFNPKSYANFVKNIKKFPQHAKNFKSWWKMYKNSKSTIGVLQGFKTMDFGGGILKLSKKGFKHILERHHPKYWSGTIKNAQSFFKKGDDVIALLGKVTDKYEDIIKAQMKLNKASGQILLKHEGRMFQLGWKNGEIGQFFPLVKEAVKKL